MSLIPPVTAAAALERRPLRTLMRLLLWLVIVAWSLVLVAWLTLHWGILPHIEQWRIPIETRASRALGVPVRIGAITVHSSGWVPAFELRDVTLLDARQRPALTLPRVFAAISPRSLLAWHLNFEQLLIEGAQLEVRRDAQGHVFVGGLDFSSASAGDEGAAADWFFEQRELVIRGGALRWTDELRQAPPLTLTDVQFVVRNRLRSHALRFDATPEAAWGERFSLSGDFTQPLLARRGDWRRWSGTAFASLPRADLHELRRHVTLPFELSEGDGSLRGWFELKDGEPQLATVDLALRAVTLRLDPTVAPLKVAQVEGRLNVQRSAEGMTLAAQRLSFITGDGVRWPQGDLSLGWRQRNGAPATGGTFSAQRLDLGVVAQLAASVPLGATLQRALTELKPRGIVTELSSRWDGSIDAPEHYQADAQVTGLTLAARASAEARGIGRPGLRNASLRLSASESGGQAQLDVRSGALEFPGVFDEPLVPIDQLTAQLVWKVEASKPAGAAPKLSLQVKGVKFSNPDAQGDMNGTWSTGGGRSPRFPGQLELDGRLDRGLAARTARYLPLGIPDAARHYVERAVRAGRIGAASFHVKGDLTEFPFVDARSTGEFRIAAQAEDLVFDYVPSAPASAGEPAFVSTWPPFTNVFGELVFDRASMAIHNARARVGPVQLSQVQGGIANFADHAALAIDGNAAGPLAEMLKYVKATPVGGWIGGALDHASGSGAADLKLALQLPLANLETSKVKGSVTLAGNDVRITPDTTLLAAAKGRVDFSEKGLAVVGATANALGGELAFDGGSQADGSVRFTGQGTASAEGLKRAAELGPLARLALAFAGQTAYRVNLGFAHGASEIKVSSNLVGLAADLPAPLRKAAETPLAMSYQTTPEPVSQVHAAATRDTLRFELGTLVQAQYQRDISGDTPRVLRGGIGVLEAAPTPASGVSANLNLASLNTDAWEAAGARLFGAPADAGDASGAGGYAPDKIALRAQEIVAGTRRLSKVVAGLSQEDGLWRANLDAEQLNGYVEYRPARRGETPSAAGRVYARLSRLSIPKSDVDQVETLLDQQPASVPALDIVVDDFELRGKHLGRIEVEAINQTSAEAGSREWRLSKFNVTTPEAQLTATGHWIAAAGAPAAKRRAVLNFKLALADSGALLDRLGSAKAIRGGKGQMSGEVSWLGSPLALDVPSLSGQINMAIDSGQFLKADTGAARLLGVLSLQSLPRRLLLDFRDVFQEGFAFDNITGDVKIVEGVAHTNNLRMRGVQAVVLMDGIADISRETQELRVIVVPEINAGTASLAYAVINPVIGISTFLAQLFLRKPLAEAGTREFHISGPWADPKVYRVEHKAGDSTAVDVDAAAPATDAPKSKP